MLIDGVRELECLASYNEALEREKSKSKLRPLNKSTWLATQERFAIKIKKIESGCWLWTRVNQHGLCGSFWFNGESVPPGRASWMMFKGYIPSGSHIRRSCENPLCVNPEHLYAIGSRESEKVSSELAFKKQAKKRYPEMAIALQESQEQNTRLKEALDESERQVWRLLQKMESEKQE